MLILKEDGTCRYKDGNSDDTEDGTWSIEDDKLIVYDCMDYDIYADIENDSESLLFEADSSFWNDELFIKSE